MRKRQGAVTFDSINETPPEGPIPIDPPLVTYEERERIAYALSTHLCYTGVRPSDKAIDVFIQRYESYTPEREAQRQQDLIDSYDEFMGAQL